MCCGALGKLIQGVSRPIRQLLKHEELCETDAELAFDAACVESECPNDATNRIHRAGGVVGVYHGCIEWGVNVSNLVAPHRARQGWARRERRVNDQGPADATFDVGRFNFASYQANMRRCMSSTSSAVAFPPPCPPFM